MNPADHVAPVQPMLIANKQYDPLGHIGMICLDSPVYRAAAKWQLTRFDFERMYVRGGVAAASSGKIVAFCHAKGIAGMLGAVGPATLDLAIYPDAYPDDPRACIAAQVKDGGPSCGLMIQPFSEDGAWDTEPIGMPVKPSQVPDFGPVARRALESVEAGHRSFCIDASLLRTLAAALTDANELAERADGAKKVRDDEEDTVVRVLVPDDPTKPLCVVAAGGSVGFIMPAQPVAHKDDKEAIDIVRAMVAKVEAAFPKGAQADG